MSHASKNKNSYGQTLQPPRDSLELGSLASSSTSSPRNSDESSSASGAPSSRKLSFDAEDPLHTPRPQAGRSRLSSRTYSVSSAFDFAAPLYPLSTTQQGGYSSLGAATSRGHGDGGSLEKHKTLTFLNGLSLVIGIVIGSGIFSSPSQVNANAGSPGAALIVWLVAGILTWTGAASFAELGAALPLNGGAQLYLAKIYGDMSGFLYSWCTVWIIKPGSAAIISTIVGEYVVRAFVGADVVDINPWVNKGVAIASLTCAVGLNAISNKVAVRIAGLFMFLKFAALLAVAILGAVVAVTHFSLRGEASTDWQDHGWFEGTTSVSSSNLAVALYAGLWAYDGWDNVNYVVGELKRPGRDLPRVIHTSMPAIMVSYLLANTAYFLVLPLAVTSTSQTIAIDFGSQILGRLGALLFALTVATSCFGGMCASAFTSGRLFFAAAKEGFLPGIFGTLGFRGREGLQTAPRVGGLKKNALQRLGSKVCGGSGGVEGNGNGGGDGDGLFATPVYALLLYYSLSVVYIIIGNFGALVTFYGVATYSFFFMTVLGLIVLRVKEPDLERPYRCWLATPIIFCCVSLFLLSRSVVAQPWSSVAVSAFELLGAIVYVWRVKPSNERGRQGEARGPWWKFWLRRSRP